MKQLDFQILSNDRIAKGTYRMKLSGDASDCAAGRFVNVQIAGKFLRRPISVCDSDASTLTLIYKAVGEGTEKMAKMMVGETVNLLTGLGNGYDTEKSGDRPLLLGGGVGVPPLYKLAKQLAGQGKEVKVILGFNSKDEVFGESEFAAIGCSVVVCTADGSYGKKGFVTDAIDLIGDYTYFYTCGPEPMLRAVCAATKTSGQLSFEERMGCGFGVCMGCSCETLTGYKRICRDGPVMEKEEIKWPTSR
jgi:dihydroorotate dehydrogenase electron transfer subunit